MLRVGVVGVGHLGSHHARLYAGMSGVELTAVCDIDGERCRQVASRFGATGLCDLDALLGVVDAVSVAVPTAAHRQVACAALARGLAVLVEKPLAPDAREARLIVETARTHGATLMVGHVERWNGAFRAVARHISRPRFIESHRLAAFSGRSLDVDVIRDLMIHDLDLVLAVAPAEVVRVQAVGVSVLTGSADIANARLEFADGMVANLTASRASRETVRKMRIFQDDAYVSCDLGARTAEIVRRPASTGTPPGDRGAAAMAVLNSLEQQHLGPFDDPDPLCAELLAFRDAALGEREPEPVGEEAVRALELAERVIERMAAASARMGVPVSTDGAALPVSGSGTTRAPGRDLCQDG